MGKSSVEKRGVRCGRTRGGAWGAWVALSAACWIAGCAQVEPVAGPASPPVNLSGYSPAFKAGFRDGCETARGNAQRSAARYQEDAQYARGWDDGRSVCRRR